jgi:hypothetical protein
VSDMVERRGTTTSSSFLYVAREVIAMVNLSSAMVLRLP